MPAASCRGRLGRKDSYQSKGSEGRSEGTVPAPSPFYSLSRRGKAQANRCPTLHPPRQYVTVFLPSYRIFRFGGNLTRRLRAERLLCPCGWCRTGPGTVSRSWRSTGAADGTPFPTYRFAPPWVFLSFRHTVLHGVPLFPDIPAVLADGWVSGAGFRALSFRAVRGAP